MRLLRERGLVDLVYLEFFDDKNLLIAKRWSAYLQKLRRYADAVKVAVWPDYCYDERIRGSFSLKWVFPLHSKHELGFALKVADYVAFPNRPELRDYTLSWFAEQKQTYSFKAWLLGLKPRHLAVLHIFDACDISGASMPGYFKKGWRGTGDVEAWEGFVRRIKAVKGAVLDSWLEGGGAKPRGA
jgi:hypothetical protein